MRTWIIDNGEAYSDHEVRFLETDAPGPVVALAVAFRNEKILATAEGRLSWRADGSSMSLPQYVPLHIFVTWDAPRDAARREFLSSDVVWTDMDGTILRWVRGRADEFPLLRWLLEHWGEWSDESEMGARWHEVSKAAAREWLTARLAQRT